MSPDPYFANSSLLSWNRPIYDPVRCLAFCPSCLFRFFDLAKIVGCPTDLQFVLQSRPCPPAVSRRPDLSKSKTPTSWCATTTASNSPMSISRMSRDGDQRPSCSPATRRGASRPTWRSCRICCVQDLRGKASRKATRLRSSRYASRSAEVIGSKQIESKYLWYRSNVSGGICSTFNFNIRNILLVGVDQLGDSRPSGEKRLAKGNLQLPMNVW
jgi:hypothetical protein